jgi:hypothetical protein
MTVQHRDPIMEIAERVTYCFSQSGYAFIEDDHVEALAYALASFLRTAGIPTHVGTAAEGIPALPPADRTAKL